MACCMWLWLSHLCLSFKHWQRSCEHLDCVYCVAAGADICNTFVLNVITFGVGPTVMELLKRCRMRRAVQTAVHQGQLDTAFAPDSLEFAPHIASALNAVFVTLTYCSALPLLIPIAACSIAVRYWFDKVCTWDQ